MRLRVVFGFVGTHDVVWWKPLPDFPNIIKYLGKNYEWVTYDDTTKDVDYVLTFSALSSYDLNYDVQCPDWKDLFKEDTGGCDCGAKHSKSFPWDHMRMCKLWKPW